MKNIKIGILREEKVPHDKRVPFSPEQCKLIKSEYPGVEVVIQPCSYRSFRDDEYRREGVVLQEDLSDCDILIHHGEQGGGWGWIRAMARTYWCI